MNWAPCLKVVICIRHGEKMDDIYNLVIYNRNTLESKIFILPI